MSASAHPSATLPPAPLRSDPEPSPRDFGPVVVPVSARFEGLLAFRGSACVEGELQGEIVCRGTLRIGEQGRVVGTIEADEVIVAGTLVGDARARGRVELAATARVRGSVRAPRLQMADGCLLEGRCETGSGPQEPGSEG